MRFRLLMLVAILWSTALWSQQEADSYTALKDSSKLDIGFKAGLNLTEFFGPDASPNKRYKAGYSLGMYVGTPLKKKWTFAAEFIWSLQGDSDAKEGKYFLSYFNVPLMFKWKKKGWYTEFGPQVGFLVLQRSEDVPEVLRVLDFQTTVLSANVGFGYKIWEDLAIGTRYSVSINQLAEDKNIRNHVLYFGLSYRVF